MELVGAKVLASCLLFCLTVTFGWMPYFCFRRHSKQLQSVRTWPGQPPTAVEYVHSLASGVLLGACFLHLLPESLRAVRESLSARDSADRCPLSQTVNITNITGHKTSVKADRQPPLLTDHFPVAECLVALGFLFIYSIDSSITSCMTWQQGKGHTNADTDNRSQSAGDQTRFSSGYIQTQGADDDSCHRHITGTDRRCKTHLAGRGEPFSYTRWFRSKLSTSAGKPAKQNQADIAEEHLTFIAPDADTGGHFDVDHGQMEFSSGECESTRTSRSVEAHPLVAETRPARPGRSAQLRSVSLVSALCIHGFFEGVMLGLQTSLPVLMSLIVALSLHKSFVSVGLSISLLSSQNAPGAARVTLSYILAFASTAPVGVLVSAVLLHNSLDTADSGLVPGGLQAFAVGTFLYVTFTETADGHGRRKLPALLFVLTGFSVMSALRAVLASA